MWLKKLDKAKIRKTHIFIINFIFLIFFNPTTLKSQEQTSFILREKNKLWIGVKLGSYEESFAVNDTIISSKISTHLLPSLGIILKYKSLPSVAIGFPIGTDSTLRTRGINILLPIVIKRRVVIQYQGALLQKMIYQSLKDTIPLNQSFSFSTNLNVYWLINSDEYSYNFAYGFGERQIKSGVTWCLGLSTRFVYIENPEFEKYKLYEDDSLQLYRFFSMFGIGLIGGFSGNLIIGFLSKPPHSLTFASIELLAGPNLTRSTLYQDALNTYRGINSLGQLKFSLGYMGKKWVYRFMVIGNHQNAYKKDFLNVRHGYIQSNLQVVRFFR